MLCPCAFVNVHYLLFFCQHLITCLCNVCWHRLRFKIKAAKLWPNSHLWVCRLLSWLFFMSVCVCVCVGLQGLDQSFPRLLICVSCSRGVPGKDMQPNPATYSSMHLSPSAELSSTLCNDLCRWNYTTGITTLLIRNSQSWMFLTSVQLHYYNYYYVSSSCCIQVCLCGNEMSSVAAHLIE